MVADAAARQGLRRSADHQGEVAGAGAAQGEESSTKKARRKEGGEEGREKEKGGLIATRRAGHHDMTGESHNGVVAFQTLSHGREAVMLGRVQVGEISPTMGGRYGACFRLTLPDASATSWRPAHDIAAARRLVLIKVNDWLNAAGLQPSGAA
jgi:hypothetical protein